VGTVPLAASAFAGTVFGMFYILGIGLLMPVAVLVSHARGANDPVGGQQLLRHGVALAVGFSLLEIAVMLVIGQQLHHFGQAPEVVAVVGPYFAIIAISILPVLVFQVVRQFAESLGQPWVPMAIMMASVLLNVVLNWLLIYGHWGLPAMGLTGAGWATLVSRVAALGALFLWLKTSPRLAEWWPPRWRGARLPKCFGSGCRRQGNCFSRAGLSPRRRSWWAGSGRCRWRRIKSRSAARR
jgi:MATE family multidrug resistance protein